MVDLKGKTAVVTGARRGIGAAIANALAEHGARVAAFDIADTDATTEATHGNGGQVKGYVADITNRDSVAEAFAAVRTDFGPIDILVNNAGIIRRGGLMDVTADDWQAVLAVNVTGVFNCCQAVVPEMKQRKSGRIVNISSVVAKTGDFTAAPVYGTSKGAVDTLTRSLAREMADFNVLVNGVAPHAIETEMSGQWSAEKRKAIVDAIPLKRLGQPNEVAAAVLFLVSPGSAFITGEIINMNGGYLMD